MDDQNLIEKVRQGDEMAYEEIVLRYKNKIVNFLYQMVGDYERAVDLAQETFMRVYFKAGHYKPIAPFSSWIYTIASNLAKTDLKRMRRHLHTPIDDIQNQLSAGIATCENQESSTMVIRVKQALDSLHPRYRIPVILKDVEGFTQEEIAQILKKPVGTIKARISRGRSYLKKELEKTTVQINISAKNREFENGRA
jgi:RNA polymerase sigma-70 factor (ECF subfamily)